MPRPRSPLPAALREFVGLLPATTLLSFPNELKGSTVTRAQRASLSPWLRHALGMRERPGNIRKGSPYVADDILVRLAIDYLDANAGMKPETAARQMVEHVRRLLPTEAERAKLRPGRWFSSSVGADAERIADKVRAAQRAAEDVSTN